MRRILAAAALLAVLPLCAKAQAPASEPPHVCIRTIDIDHTRTPDNRTILFYMRDGKVWQTRLTAYCPQLVFDGFAYVATPPDNICGNLQTIRVIRSGAICEMGPLVPVPPSHGS